MNSNTNNWLDVGDDELKKQQAIRYYCRHFVSLAGSYQAIDQEGNPLDDARAFAFSGFLMFVKNGLTLVTAGHILKGLDDKLKATKIVLPKCVLIDNWGHEARHMEPIPFAYEDAPKFFIDNRQHGLDFGLVSISPYYARLLKKNNVKAIPKENWLPPDNITFDEYIMLGLPEELMAEGDGGTVTPTPAIVPLTRLDNAPEGFEKPFPQFVGKIFDNVTIEDMVGMSGGPIFGIGMAPDGKRRYWTVAVQSAWLKDRRITFGCPIHIFMDLVESMLAEHAHTPGHPPKKQ